MGFKFPKKLSKERIKVIEDPNFGYETIGGDYEDLDNTIEGSIFTCPEVGTADSITVALMRLTAGSNKVKCAIYKHSDLSLVGATEERTLSLTTSFAWYTFNFVAPKPSLTANEVYLLVAWAEYTTEHIEIAETYPGDTNQGHYKILTYTGNFPDPLSVDWHADIKFSIYCTYTAGGAPPPAGGVLAQVM